MKFKGIIIGILIVTASVVACDNQNKESSDSEQTDSTLVDSGKIATGNAKEVKSEGSFVDVVDTCMLRIYYPNFSRIDLVCGKIPDKREDNVILVCAAAYTVKCLDHFDHSNIIGNHVSGGKLYKGAPMKLEKGAKACYRGAFSFYDGKPHFAYDDWNSDFHKASQRGGCGFAQDMMIHQGGIVNHWRDDGSKNQFRALCLINGKVAVADSKEVLPFRDFIQNLIQADATEAIYMDMGGWKHSWYRDESGNAIDIHPSPTKFGTNWITFYK